MSVGSSSDIGQAPAGFEGQASPSIPGQGQPGQFPTEATDAALTDQGVTSAPASAGAESLDLTEDDLQWLQSEPVLNYLKANLPPGFLTEDAHKQRLADFQSKKDQEIAQAQRQAAELQRQFEEYELTANQLANALAQSWQEQGLQQGSEEWNQRAAAVRGALDAGKRDREYQRMSAEQAVNQLVTQETDRFRGDLGLAGLQFDDPYVIRAYQEHLTRLRSGVYQQSEQVDLGRRQLLDWARQQSQAAQQQPAQQPVQQQAVAAQGPAQPAAQTRPAGATRSARGGGGSGPRTYEDYFQAKYAELIQQHGGEHSIPISAIKALDLEAAQQAGG